MHECTMYVLGRSQTEGGGEERYGPDRLVHLTTSGPGYGLPFLFRMRRQGTVQRYGGWCRFADVSMVRRSHQSLGTYSTYRSASTKSDGAC